MKDEYTNQNGGPADSGSDLAWLDQRWFTGTPEQHCRYCGLPVVFTPACLEIEVCKCNNPISDRRTFTLEVRFSRIQTFRVKIVEAKIPLQPSARSHQFAFSGRTLPARNGNPCRRVLEALPRAHGDGHRVAMPRPRRFNFPRLPAAPAEVNPQKTRSA
jgi:hypothetical protein